MATWNRLVRYIPSSAPAGSSPRLGEPVVASLDVGLALRNGEEVEVEVYSGSSVLDPGSKTGEREKIGTALSPVSQEEVGAIRCIGLNYHLHAVEASLPLPPCPILFLKPSTSLAGSYPSKIVVPRFVLADNSADFEAELGVIIAKECKDVSEEQAMEYVAGYVASNDVSSRKKQFETSQWGFSKGFDTACPIGPVIVSPRLVPDPSKLRMRGLKNGVVMQETGLDDLIFPIAHLISYLSQGTTLPAGTLILTGTPHGIGAYHSPPQFLQHGDEFVVEVLPHVGSLINVVQFEGQEEGKL